MLDIAKRFGKIVADNSPAILTAVGVTGAVATAVLTGRASFKAAEVLAEQETGLEPKERVKLCWKLYIPAVSVGVLTVTAIVVSNRIGTRRAAALAAAYALVEKGFDEYKEKVIEKLGDKKEQALRDELAQDRVNRYPPDESQIIFTNPDASVLCYEAYTGRYFVSDMETLRKAMNDINHQINADYYASLSDLYDRIGLEHTQVSYEMGWNCDKLLEFEFSSTLTATGRPVLVLNYRVQPIRNYHRVQ